MDISLPAHPVVTSSEPLGALYASMMVPWAVLLALSAAFIIAECETTYLMQPAKQREGT